MVSSLLNVTVQKPQALQVRLDDEQGMLVASATARGLTWMVEIVHPVPAVFTINSYLTEAKMAELLQALVTGYRVLADLTPEGDRK